MILKQDKIQFEDKYEVSCIMRALEKYVDDNCKSDDEVIYSKTLVKLLDKMIMEW